MDEPTLLRTLTLEGFRAYLQPKTFDLSKKSCLAIFAPNGLGKSSVIDALEFLFSDEGTLERLGTRMANNRAGPSALAHNGACEANVSPMVKFSTVTGREINEGSRAASGNQRPIDATATAMKANFVVSPIIRGYKLRTFVETQTPEQRYSDVAAWLQLTPLVEVQKNLRQLRREVNAASQSTTEQTRLTQLLRTETENELQDWDNDAVLDFINTSIVAPLDPSLTLAALRIEDTGYTEITRRIEAEEKRIGLAGLRQIRNAVLALWQKIEPDDGSNPRCTGAIATFDAGLAALADAKTNEAEKRGEAAGVIFLSVWREAEALFADDASAPSVCPICDTDIDRTAAGSVAAIRDLTRTHLSDLEMYREAKSALEGAKAAAIQAHNQLEARLPAMIEHLLHEDDVDLKTALAAYQESLAKWPQVEAPDSDGIVAGLERYLAGLDQAIESIEAMQGDHTWAKAKVRIDRLMNLQQEVALATRKTEELSALHDSLVSQATLVSSRIREKLQSLIDTLQAPMNQIYREIQGANAKPIRLVLPRENEANQHRMQLVVDFAENRLGVVPGSYLSDSQIHSVALALRLAAIKKFNSAAPLVALDDVVTSYDADHRRAIGAVLATMFTECQIILVTHDERFFNSLKDQLLANTWEFKRIIRMDPDFGPRFADHKVTSDMIAARWDKSELAANEMRQAEEEWLLSIARGFGVSVRIRELERAYSYDRSELASAIGRFLKDRNLTPANVPGVNNSFIASLIRGDIENFGSHFQDAPYGNGSIGDERKRWDEFEAFRAQFQCVCGRTKYKRSSTHNRPICAHKGCETPFVFKPPAATVEVAEAATTDD